MEIKNGIPHMQHEEWLAEGYRRFGENIGHWKFVCPVCKNVASIDDFKNFKHCGASPNSATNECIGRYLPKEERYEAIGLGPPGAPCDYALYGLIKLPGVIVIQDGKETPAFAFAEEN